MNQPEEKISNSGEEKPIRRHRSRKYGRSAKKKKFSFNRIRRWIKKNPSKTIAIFSIALILVLTILFYLYDSEMLTAGDIRPENKDAVKGISLPVYLVSESSPVVIRFGSITRTVSLEELRKGYVISPEKLVNCAIENGTEDQTQFTILLVEDRLYVNAAFKNLSDDVIAASINHKNWKVLSTNPPAFYSDENSFKVTDVQGNISFRMEFNKPESLSIQGYFISKDCVYVIGHNINYADVKTGNYMERAMPYIKKLNNN